MLIDGNTSNMGVNGFYLPFDGSDLIDIDRSGNNNHFTPVGMRFSNPVLQTLLVLLRKVPPVAGRSLMIVATTAIEHLLQDLQLPQAFNVTLHVSKLQNADEIQKVLEGSGLTNEEAEEIGGAIGALESPIGIKQLLMVLEMARANADGPLDSSIFLECLHTCGF